MSRVLSTVLRRRPADHLRRREDGTTTAEYAVGTLGAVTCGAVLLQLGTDGWFLDRLRELVLHSLGPSTLLELLRHGRPFTPVR